MASLPLMSLAIVQTWFDFFFLPFLFDEIKVGFLGLFFFFEGDGSLESCFPVKSHKPVTGKY